MKLSIITINYNNASGLDKTIGSIVADKSSDIEYLVIDGASTDGSIAIIKKYISKIDYWVSEQDNGIYNAMNKGIKKATGDYVMFVNSGDLIKDMGKVNKLARQTPGEDIIYFNIEVRGGQLSRAFMKKYPAQPDFKYFVEDSLPHVGTLIRREKLVEYGYYNENLKIVSDWAFFVDAILLHNYTHRYIDADFAIFYLDGISSKPENSKLLLREKSDHIKRQYPVYYSMCQDWMQKKEELYKLKRSLIVKCAKKVGLLKWLKS